MWIDTSLGPKRRVFLSGRFTQPSLRPGPRACIALPGTSGERGPLGHVSGISAGTPSCVKRTLGFGQNEAAITRTGAGWVLNPRVMCFHPCAAPSTIRISSAVRPYSSYTSRSISRSVAAIWDSRSSVCHLRNWPSFLPLPDGLFAGMLQPVSGGDPTVRGGEQDMDVAQSLNGVPIRLTYERWYHIVENHDERPRGEVIWRP
jgi:hypothetical protein